MTLNLEPITQALVLQQGLRLAIVYGSCAKGLQRPDSDLDIAVDMGQVMDRIVIDQKLESLRRCLARIRTKLPLTADTFKTDFDVQDIISLNLTREVQMAVDIGAHIVSSQQQVTPGSMGETFDHLSQLEPYFFRLGSAVEKISWIQKHTRISQGDFISLTDIAKLKNPVEPKDVVKNWLRSRSTLDFLGLWEKINIPRFKRVEFDSFKNQGGHICL